ncbi:hypothetical protein CSAL01_03312 [Colletotrichum salicis]|uniref:protein-ribulosamine 3-kinase n=1 Tax=Colletotrichum salicis TaxID=1209931 RepID=A0A135TIA3_9PEZI|nr:hypothetical protein CSAL01_03312 [Colletotrichum salicis]
METSTALPTVSQTKNLINHYDSNAISVDVNLDSSLVTLEQHNVDLELHLRNQKLRARQDRKFPTDEAMEEALPEGLSIDSAESFGYSAWAVTGFISEPSGYGKYKKEDLPTYFYMTKFVDFDVTRAQDPANFCNRLTELHERSQTLSDRFGFHVTTCDGNRPPNVEWESSWAEFYRKLLLHTLSLDIKKNGTWDKYERAAHQVASNLIHGDLWEGNTGISKETNLPMLFDAGSYFAHNEMELGHWACEFSPIFGKQAYMDWYLACFPKAEPVDEFDDRIRLYSLKGGINYSASHPNSRLRTSAYNSMLYLCEKYAPIVGITSITGDLVGSNQMDSGVTKGLLCIDCFR